MGIAAAFLAPAPLARAQIHVRVAACTYHPPRGCEATSSPPSQQAASPPSQQSARVRALDARVVLRGAQESLSEARRALARDADADPAAARDRPGSGRLRDLLRGCEGALRAVKRLEGDGKSGLEDELGGAVLALREAVGRREVEEARREGEVVEEVGEVEGTGKRVKETFLVGRDELLRRASTVGAGLEGTVSSFVNEEGSVDLEKVRSSVRGGVDRFSESWQRLNGRDPQEGGGGDEKFVESGAGGHAPPVKDGAKIARLRSEIGSLESRLIEASKTREGLLRKEDQLGKLIRAREIRAMDDSVSAVRRELAVRVMQLETENIFASLSQEIERPGLDEMMDQRVMVAEFGDIDDRLESLAALIDTNEPALVDDDEVGELASDIQDLKMRLGLDAPLYSTRFDLVTVKQSIGVAIVKAKAGADFYSRGFKLFFGDCTYALRLFRRVFVGYTLSPREVRTLRRTGRDFLTLIPFTIILIAPLTPVGHVLIFGFIQRYWPDFFPSTFSERRQSLMRRHQEFAKGFQEGGKSAAINGDSGEKNVTDSAVESTDGKTAGFNILRRVGLSTGKVGRGVVVESGEEKPSSSAPLGAESSQPVVELDRIAATSSDVLASLAQDGSLDGLERVDSTPATERSTRRRRGRRSRPELDDLHLAD